MDAQAISMAMSAVATQSATQSGYGTGQTDGTGTDFAQLLMAMTGQNRLNGLTSGLGTDLTGLGSGDLSSMLGLSLDSWQNSLMLNALQSLSQSSGRPVVTDPVLANLLAMMQNLGTGNASEADQKQLMDLIEQMQQRLKQMVEEDGAQAAGQQMLAIMNSMMPQLAGVNYTDTAYQVLAQDGGQNILQTVLETSPENVLNLLSGKPLQAEGQSGVAHFAVQSTETQQTAAQGGESGVTAQTEEYVAAPKPDFEAAVRGAVSRFTQAGTQKAQQDGAAVDIDALQQRVDSGVYLENTTYGQAQPLAAATPAQQLTQPLQAAIQNGSEEITVKLTPEDLGEVTVKLAKNAEGIMTLSLIAKKPETQQLLAAQMQDLQNSLKPMQVEVDSILTERQYELLSHQQSFDQGHRQASYSPQNAAYFGTAAQDDQPDAPVSALTEPSSMLDTRI